MPDALKMRQAVWSRHWASGAGHSCAGSFWNDYGGEIAAFWRAMHATTPSGACVLDLATGGGAVPRLLLHSRPDLPVDLHAVDLATTAPAWVRERPPGAPGRVTFHGGTRVEALPLRAASVDLVTSQYGIEYAEVDAALDEVLRVRAPRGRIAFVLHHAESRPVRLAAIELAHLAVLLGPEGLVAACAAMLRPMAQAATAEGRARLAQDSTAHAARQAFNAAQSAVTARGRGQPDGADVLGEAQDAAAQVLALAGQRGEAVARDAHARWLQHLQDARLRLEELRRCALDAPALQGWVQRLQRHGLTVETATLAEGAHLMGWTLLAG